MPPTEKEINELIAHLLKKFPECSESKMIWARHRESPFRVLIGTILSQRARDPVTERIAYALFSKYKTPKQLSNAKQRDVEKIIRSIGFYRNKAKNIINVSKIIVDKYGEKVPKSEKKLLKLPGVGQKTCDCVLLYGYGKAVIPVDTHVHQVSNLLGWVHTKTPEKTKIELEKFIKGRQRKVVNCLFVSLGQATRYKKHKLEEYLGKKLHKKYFG